MLKVPQLDEVTYDQIIQKAISRIPARTEDWTDYNSHDPGVTVLETFAWLTDMLNYYMDATGEAHVEKYLKLLGILPEMAAPATGYVVVEQKEKELVIPEGTELLAGEIPFETQKEYRGDKNRFCSVPAGSGGKPGGSDRPLQAWTETTRKPFRRDREEKRKRRRPCISALRGR